MLPESRAMALVSCLAGDNGEPFDLIPEPYRTQGREARERLNGQDRIRRAAALARESVECFSATRADGGGPQSRRRPLPRGLVLALAPSEPPAPATDLPLWLERATSAVRAIGMLALARAASASGPSAMAEVARRLGHDGALALLDARRVQADPALARRSVLVAALAMEDSRAGGDPPDVATRAGLYRLAWALSTDRAALAGTRMRLPEGDASVFERAAAVASFLGSAEADPERESILADLERTA